MISGSTMLCLECRLPSESWHTLNTGAYATSETKKQERHRLSEFQQAWARQDLFQGHQFRIVERAS